MVIHNETQYIAVPYSEPQFHLTPLPHTTPLSGEASLSSIQVVQSKRSRLPRLLPVRFSTISSCILKQLALQSVAATKYRNGILNTYTSHEDEIEIAPLPGDRNDQPFFILSESGPQYVVAVEPYGDARDSRSCGRSTAKAAPSNGTCQPTRCSAHSEQRTS